MCCARPICVATSVAAAGVPPPGFVKLAAAAPPRIGSRRHPKRATIGPVVAAVAAELGFELHDWQLHVADVAGELVPRGRRRRLAAKMVGAMVGRQSGKTALAATQVATRCLAPSLPDLEALLGFRPGPQHVAFTAQDRIGALGRWYEHVELIMASPLAEGVAKVVRKNGEECVHWWNGSKYRVVTPSKTGARGLSLDLVVIDEALAHEPWLLAAIRPTQAQRDGALSSFGAQLFLVSNAGDETAELLNEQRDLGRRAALEDDSGRVWMEWSCADDADPLDPAVWAATVPTLDRPNGISSEFLRLEAESLGIDQFAREYLCRTVVSKSRQVIDPDVWADLPHIELFQPDRVTLGIDATSDLSRACVVACAQSGEFVGVQVMRNDPDTDWVAGYVTQLAQNWRARVAIDRTGPVAQLIPQLELAKIKVVTLSGVQTADAAAGLVELVAAGGIGHTGDPVLADAVAVLARRARGDRWVFDRSRGYVAPIVATSLAAWVVSTRPLRIPKIH